MKALAAAIPLRGIVVTTGMLIPLPLGRGTSVKALTRHVEEGLPLVLVPQVDASEEDIHSAELAEVGVMARALRIAEMPDGTARALVEGGERVHVGALRFEKGASVIEFEPATDSDGEEPEVLALAQQLYGMAEEWLASRGISGLEASVVLAGPDQPDRLCDQVAARLALTTAQRIELLQMRSRVERLTRVADHLASAIAVQSVGMEIEARMNATLEENERQYHLKEQLRAVREALGDTAESETDALEFRVRSSDLPARAEEEAVREVQRLRRIAPDTPEYTIIRSWLETVCDLPWNRSTVDHSDLRQARKILDSEHFGLESIKERILEYLAVRQLKPDSEGPVLCFVGPPGVGKSSLGLSIARALGRNYGRIALGGVRDETEIRGHRRTYVGAMPGRIVRALTRAGSSNPVIVLDELDKLGADFRGDPSSALLEVLDPEQNHAFGDHYLDIEVDLTQVLFIATANLVDPIPPALADRLEIIELPGYTEEEKVQIARKFLIPRAASQAGLDPDQALISDDALESMIRHHTREAGVRDLSRQLQKVHRKVARRIVEDHHHTHEDKERCELCDRPFDSEEIALRITERNLPRYLGPVRYHGDLEEESIQPGVVLGLAYTATGGEMLFIECARIPGTLSLKLTGLLGEAMRESAEAAMSWLRSNAKRLGITPSAFEAEFHLHVPAGAIQKDGPSAGVAMLCALASAATGRPARPHVALTGETTLRGRVLPVGGIQEKVLAARRAGIQEVLLPVQNRADLEEVPESVREELVIHFVRTNDEVLRLALGWQIEE